MNVKKILAVINATYAVAKRKCIFLFCQVKRLYYSLTQSLLISVISVFIDSVIVDFSDHRCSLSFW